LTVAGVVAALDREARALGPARHLQGRAGLEVLTDGTLRAVSGMGGAAAGMAARRLIEAGATALVSWGMAGGLDPDLTAGALVLPREVVAPDGMRFATAAAWRETLTASIAACRPVAAGALLTSMRPLDGATAKAAARHETGAVAVDMESSAVAEVAAASHVPFLAVRVIVDTALDPIPTAVIAAGESGRVQMSRLLLGLAHSPRDLVPLMRLALRYRAAMRSLRAVGRLGALAPRALPGESGGARCGEPFG
jgi:adenosylhomocysteine nucleosidase